MFCNKTYWLKNVAFFALLVLSFLGCTSTPKEQHTPHIVCTTGMLGDAVKTLMGKQAKVEVLMGPGVDPHLYKASQGDVAKLAKADVIIYNGLHLEGKMGEIFEKLNATKTILPAAEVLDKDDLLSAEGYTNTYDPHVWFDLVLWQQVIAGLQEDLGQLYPELKDSINLRGDAYQQALEEMNGYCEELINIIPQQQRVLITAHDAFKYFGKAYELEVRGLQGISTTAEYGLRDVSELVDFIYTRKIKAIFIESSVSPKSIEAVIEGCREKGHEVILGGELYSDALGEKSKGTDTYLGMVRHNVDVISESLR